MRQMVIIIDILNSQSKLLYSIQNIQQLQKEIYVNKNYQ